MKTFADISYIEKFYDKYTVQSTEPAKQPQELCKQYIFSKRNLSDIFRGTISDIFSERNNPLYQLRVNK